MTPACPPGSRRIVAPEAGRTDEYEIAVTVDVPEEDLPRRLLTLVIIRNGEIVARKEKPTLDSRVTVPGVRLREGTENELDGGAGGPRRAAGTALRAGAGDPGPRCTQPGHHLAEKGTDTYDKTITLSITSEPGAEVRIRNEANDWGPRKRVAPTDGEIEVDVRLSYGSNKIVVESDDPAGRTRAESVNVRRRDGRPYVNVKAPRSIDKSALPRRIVVQVKVADDKGEAMEGAMVAVHVGGTWLTPASPSRSGLAQTARRSGDRWWSGAARRPRASSWA